MAHIFQPVQILGDFKCCLDPLDGRTEATLLLDSTATGAQSWNLYRAFPFGTPATNFFASSLLRARGRILFGVCCRANIEMTLDGVMEQLRTGFDNITVLHNTLPVFNKSSTASSPDPYDVEIFNTVLNIDVTEELPCGHLIEIIGDTIETTANNGVGWDVSIAIT